MESKTLLVACAMNVEAEIFINSLSNVKETKIAGFSFYDGVYEDCRMVVLVSGPGVINMASALTLGINYYKPLYILNYGVVGGLGNNIHQGDIIICNECLNIGSYMSSNLCKGDGVDFNKWDFITFTDGGIDEFFVWKCDNKLLELVIGIKNNYDKGNVFVGRIGSSDSWDKEYDKLVMLRDRYDIICEDMECISVYQVSNMFDIPCLSVKVVSDNSIILESYDKGVLDKSKKFIIDILKVFCDELKNEN